MELEDVLKKRKSVRKYLDKEVSSEDSHSLLVAAMTAPSACNKQPWDFYVITNKEKLIKLQGATRFSNIHAPLAIVVCGNLSRSLSSQYAPYWIQDCSAATENILLKATDLGLGSLWCGVHPQIRCENRVREILSLKDNEVPLNIIYIGYSNDDREPMDKFNEKRIHYVK